LQHWKINNLYNLKTIKMNELEKELEKMDIHYFGTSGHIMSSEAFLSSDNNVFLDVRAKAEQENLKLPLKDFCDVLEIPVNEMPKRINEVPKDKLIGIFCSAGIRASIIFAYLLSKGYTNMKILAGGYGPLTDALKPGKILKKISK